MNYRQIEKMYDEVYDNVTAKCTNAPVIQHTSHYFSFMTTFAGGLLCHISVHPNIKYLNFKKDKVTDFSAKRQFLSNTKVCEQRIPL